MKCGFSLAGAKLSPCLRSSFDHLDCEAAFLHEELSTRKQDNFDSEGSEGVQTFAHSEDTLFLFTRDDLEGVREFATTVPENPVGTAVK